jgi:hypothetical protein
MMAVSSEDLISGYGASYFRFCLAAVVILSAMIMNNRMRPVHLRIFLNLLICWELAGKINGR